MKLAEFSRKIFITLWLIEPKYVEYINNVEKYFHWNYIAKRIRLNIIKYS